MLDPTDYGWERDLHIQLLHPVMMTQPCAVPELLKDVVCDCRHGKCDKNCCFVINEQACTAECECKAAIALVDESDDDEEHEVTCLNPKTLEVFCPLDTDSESDIDSGTDSD